MVYTAFPNGFFTSFRVDLGLSLILTKIICPSLMVFYSMKIPYGIISHVNLDFQDISKSIWSHFLGMLSVFL
jgi:hypothetical protein